MTWMPVSMPLAITYITAEKTKATPTGTCTFLVLATGTHRPTNRMWQYGKLGAIQPTLEGSVTVELSVTTHTASTHVGLQTARMK